MRRWWDIYKKAYGGLSTASWMLALIQLVNRSGSMVLPFLAIYMTTQLGYSVQQVGAIMSTYGIGSLAGSYLGGWLTDKIGAFKVQFNSLFLGGLSFFLLPFLTGYVALLAGILLSSTLIEMLRPANTTSVSLYARPENITRAFSLNRLAINLGVSVGPAIGGLLAGISYTWIFVADGITCIIAAGVFYAYFHDRPVRQSTAAEDGKATVNLPRPKPLKDKIYILFAMLCGLYGMLFLQIFQVLPLYYRQEAGLSEPGIGLILGFNGLIVFAIEMVLVYAIENRFALQRIIVVGVLLCGLSFLILLLGQSITVLYAGMLLLSLSEILAMPFMVTLVVQRAGAHARGSYLGVYTMSWSLAFIVSPGISTYFISHYGFDGLWWFNGVISGVIMLGIVAITGKMQGQPRVHAEEEALATNL
jgi:predicted MFS family arabinose efflux permease